MNGCSSLRRLHTVPIRGGCVKAGAQAPKAHRLHHRALCPLPQVTNPRRAFGAKTPELEANIASTERCPSHVNFCGKQGAAASHATGSPCRCAKGWAPHRRPASRQAQSVWQWAHICVTIVIRPSLSISPKYPDFTMVRFMCICTSRGASGKGRRTAGHCQGRPRASGGTRPALPQRPARLPAAARRA